VPDTHEYQTEGCLRKEKVACLSHFRGGSHPFNDPERKKWQDPEAILSSIGLKAGLVFADIGCGGGFFTLPAARMVGKKGKVYGLDANPASIAALQEQADKEGLKNVYLTAGRAEETRVCEHCADILFFGIALHDFQDAPKVLENARRILKPGGKLIDLDWKKEQMLLGPPLHIRFDKEKALRLIEQAGFIKESVKDSGLYHYLITAKPAF
jgi:ubiquinone/menaquinone biosynthesis C-methylase UbiE